MTTVTVLSSVMPVMTAKVGVRACSVPVTPVHGASVFAGAAPYRTRGEGDQPRYG